MEVNGDNKWITLIQNASKEIYFMIHFCPHCGKEWESNIDYGFVWCEPCRINIRQYWKPQDFIWKNNRTLY